VNTVMNEPSDSIKGWVISWPVEWLLASRVVLCSMELVRRLDSKYNIIVTYSSKLVFGPLLRFHLHLPHYKMHALYQEWIGYILKFVYLF
jgi:hypothetical protein